MPASYHITQNDRTAKKYKLPLERPRKGKEKKKIRMKADKRRNENFHISKQSDQFKKMTK